MGLGSLAEISTEAYKLREEVNGLQSLNRGGRVCPKRAGRTLRLNAATHTLISCLLTIELARKLGAEYDSQSYLAYQLRLVREEVDKIREELLEKSPVIA